MHKLLLLLLTVLSTKQMNAQITIEKLIKIGESNLKDCKLTDSIIKEKGFYPMYYDVELDQSLEEFWKEMNYQHAIKDVQLFINYNASAKYKLKVLSHDYDEYKRWKRDIDSIGEYTLRNSSSMSYSWSKSGSVEESIEIGIDCDVKIQDGRHATVTTKVPATFYFLLK